MGRYPLPPGVSTILGLEFAGTIEEIGTGGGATQDEHNWKTGDEVFGLTYGGAYAEYVAVSKRMLLRKPSELSWEECAGVPEVRRSFHTPPSSSDRMWLQGSVD